jgi:copper chaperone CopZ
MSRSRIGQTLAVCAVAMLAAGAFVWAGAQAGATSPQAVAAWGPEGNGWGTVETTTLAVSGIDCTACVQAITNSLKGARGVESVKALSGGRFAVRYDPTLTTPQELVKVVEATKDPCTNGTFTARAL